MAGRGRGPKPLEVQDAIRCRTWGCLLVAGGLLDQPMNRMARMQAAAGVYDAFRAYSTKKMSDAEWSIEHPDLWATVVSTTKLMERMEVEDGTS